jgi:hypothetical protein
MISLIFIILFQLYITSGVFIITDKTKGRWFPKLFVYYESMSWELCRCDEKLKGKDEGSTRLTCSGFGH